MPEHREEWESFRVPKAPRYVLASSLDGLALLHRDMKDLLESTDLPRQVPTEKGCAGIGSVANLPSHAVVDRGRLVGLWQYYPTAGAVVWMSFIGDNAALRKAVQQTERFIREEFGDARSFSLDSPKSREPRLAALRTAARA